MPFPAVMLRVNKKSLAVETPLGTSVQCWLQYIIQNSEDFEDLEQLEPEMGHMQRWLCTYLNDKTSFKADDSDSTFETKLMLPFQMNCFPQTKYHELSNTSGGHSLYLCIVSKVFVHSVSHKDSGLRFEIVLALRHRDAVSQLGALRLVIVWLKEIRGESLELALIPKRMGLYQWRCFHPVPRFETPGLGNAGVVRDFYK